jgi:hypothetical protein
VEDALINVTKVEDALINVTKVDEKWHKSGECIDKCNQSG